MSRRHGGKSRSEGNPRVKATNGSEWPVAILLVNLAAPVRGADDFEKHVRPLLVEKCQSCHGAQKPKGRSLLDSRPVLLKGIDSDPAIMRNKPSESLRVKAIGYTGMLKMPPKGNLSEKEIALLSR
jgi:Planctomycete cytochrome C